MAAGEHDTDVAFTVVLGSGYNDARAATVTLCNCVDPGVECTGCFVQGVCPAGEVCTFSEGPCGCGAP